MSSRVPSAIALDLLKNGKYSNMSIVCQGVEFKLHRSIVCNGSPMLDAALRGQLKEAQTGRIEFPEEIPSILSRVILYLYTGRYEPLSVPDIFQRLCADPEEWNLSGAKDQIEDVEQVSSLHTKLLKGAMVSAMVYQSADMLMVNDLKPIAREHFIAYARGHFLDHGFHNALRIMFENTPEDDKELRLPIMETMLRHRSRPGYEWSPIPEETIEVLRQHSAGWWDLAVQELVSFRKTSEEEIKTVQTNLEAEYESLRGKCERQVYEIEYDTRRLLQAQANGLIDTVNSGDNLRCKHNLKIYCHAVDPRDTAWKGSQWGMRMAYECTTCQGYGYNYNCEDPPS